MPEKATCERGDCGRDVKAHGMCQMHYDRERQRHSRRREDRVLATRARNRATAALVKAHAEEFADLLTSAAEQVREEHARIVALAEEMGVEVDDKRVFRLKRGPAAEDQAVEERAELQPHEYECSFCSRVHERGHGCPECGTTLGMPVERATSRPDLRTSADHLIKQRERETAAALSAWDEPDTRYRMPPPEWDDDEVAS